MVSSEFLVKALGNAAFCRSASRTTRSCLERATLEGSIGWAAALSGFSTQLADEPAPRPLSFPARHIL